MINYTERYRPMEKASVQNPDKRNTFRTLLETFVPKVKDGSANLEPLFEGLHVYRAAYKRTEKEGVSNKTRQEIIRKDLMAGGILDPNNEQRASVQIEALQSGFHADEGHWNELLDRREKQPSIFKRPRNRAKPLVDMV